MYCAGSNKAGPFQLEAGTGRSLAGVGEARLLSGRLKAQNALTESKLDMFWCVRKSVCVCKYEAEWISLPAQSIQKINGESQG